MKQRDYILKNQREVLEFLKSKFPLYHLSNFFFRDIQYGIQMLLKSKKMNIGYSKAEEIARAFAEQLEREKIFVPVDSQSWAVNFPEFKTPVVKAPVAAKPAPPAPAAPRVAGAAPASAPKPAAVSNEPQAGTGQ